MLDSSEYERGHREGGIDQRMAGFDAHFQQINGSVAQTAERLGELSAGIVGLHGDIRAILASLDAAERTRIATAAALKEQEEARRDRGGDSWAPWSRVLTVVSVAIAAGSVAYAFLHH